MKYIDIFICIDTYIANLCLLNFYTDELERFFIASCREHSRIIAQLQQTTGVKYVDKWKKFKNKWVQQSSGETAKHKLERVFGGNCQSGSKSKEDKKGYPDGKIWELGKTVREWRNALVNNYELAGLGQLVSKSISWTQCPYREICNHHKMTAAELNQARGQYPDFHHAQQTYRTSGVEHLFCNVFKYSYSAPGKFNPTGHPHIIKYSNRTIRHLFPGPHSANYNYLHWMLYVLCQFNVYCIFYVIQCILYI